jgi:hypothetical protein
MFLAVVRDVDQEMRRCGGREHEDDDDSRAFPARPDGTSGNQRDRDRHANDDAAGYRPERATQHQGDAGEHEQGRRDQGQADRGAASVPVASAERRFRCDALAREGRYGPE